ncbi:MAG: accessory Sec system translocase SecA2, partial [Streptosporangiales bacterium]
MASLRKRVSGRIRRMLDRTGAVDLESYRSLLPRIAAREDGLRDLPADELTAAAGKLGAAASGSFTDDQLMELCALGREAARRGLDERPYDVQLLGTLAMVGGHVAEMATGEGKTLSGALAASGYALLGRDVHVLSVNDYLARRDAEWMRPVYGLLGLTTGWIGQDSTPDERRAAYAADVAYVSVSEVGFDVLRDRLATDVSELVVPGQDVALVDEADSVLVDEARVPLVLAGAADSGVADDGMAALVKTLRARRDYEVDADKRTVHLTEAGARAIEEALGGIDLYAADQLQTLAAVQAALHARVLLSRDVDYVVRDGRVQLVDDSRGRVARLQRWPDGLQAAVEAKEGLTASETGEILDTLTVQALVRRYATACGMTGTAMAAAEQFREFYALEIAVVPPNRPCIRTDEPDRLYA